MVIVSELPENPGRTITEESLALIRLVCHKFALNPTKTMWLEHYPQSYFHKEETYKQLILIECNVWSSRINKQQLEALLSVKLS